MPESEVNEMNRAYRTVLERTDISASGFVDFHDMIRELNLTDLRLKNPNENDITYEDEKQTSGESLDMALLYDQIDEYYDENNEDVDKREYEEEEEEKEGPNNYEDEQDYGYQLE